MSRRTRLVERAHRPLGAETPTATTATGRAGLVWLHDDAASDSSLTGAKAAALAVAMRLQLPVLPGLVLTTSGAERLDDLRGELRQAWTVLTDNGRHSLAVRSSSTNEDGATSSMAGIFSSVLDVEGWPAVLDAIRVVLASSDEHPMAVLLQPMLDAELGGVLFGVDPVGGRSDRLLVESVPGGPAALVSGMRSGTRHVLSMRGRLVETDESRSARSLTFRRRHALAAIARATHDAFGGPQDVEWAFDRAGLLWLLQSRPVTAAAAATALNGPVLGPGPVAETLPGVLAPLEEDLWVVPMRTGVETALRIVGVRSQRALARSPVVRTVRGRVAADLELLGERVQPPSLFSRLDPREPARRLGAAWRVGRLRRALPLLAADLADELDEELAAVPALSELADDQLVGLLHRTAAALHSAHGYEVLAGILGFVQGGSANAAALDALARARARGVEAADLVAAEPITLMLSTPKIGQAPAIPAGLTRVRDHVDVHDLGPREALRVRIRWLHELSSRAAIELGTRLCERKSLSSPEIVRWLHHDELDAVVHGAPTPADLEARCSLPSAPPLPSAFRLADDGTPVAVIDRSGRLAGRGAGGGRGVGMVHDLVAGAPPPGSVLVVQALEPGLAGVLPGAAGLVAETGSVLSHLAILARELGVPTVVGVVDAVDRFPPGETVVVDGSTGEVTLVQEALA